MTQASFDDLSSSPATDGSEFLCSCGRGPKSCRPQSSPFMSVISLCGMPIFEQLQMEEALLRAGTGNWCLINSGTPPAIVMGMLGKIEEDVEKVELPVIRRFSGGGTVVVDEDTIFLTLIVDGCDLQCAVTPGAVMAWTQTLLAPAFAPHVLAVEGQDYVIDGMKIGGNAQSFTTRRMLHHTSFLWSWRKERMELLKMPQRQPSYRKGRSHGAFCDRLERYFQSKEIFVEALVRSVSSSFQCMPGKMSVIEDCMKKPYSKRLLFIS